MPNDVAHRLAEQVVELTRQIDAREVQRENLDQEIHELRCRLKERTRDLLAHWSDDGSLLLDRTNLILRAGDVIAVQKTYLTEELCMPSGS